MYRIDSVKDINLFLSCLCSVHSLLKSAFNTVAIEKEKIKQILSDQEQSDQSAQINSLRKSLSQVMRRLPPLPMMPLSFYHLLGLVNLSYLSDILSNFIFVRRSMMLF